MKENQGTNQNIISVLYSKILKHSNLDKKLIQEEADTNNFKYYQTNIIINSNNPKQINVCYSHIFPLIYFFTAITVLLFLIVVNIFQEKYAKRKLSNYPFHPFPVFFSLKTIQPLFFSISIVIIAISGLLNVWFFSSILLQRFSVPELRPNKMTVHLMFIIGIFANIIYIFFGFSPQILKFETIKIRKVKISLSLIIFLVFIFFNILFSVMTIFSLESLKRKNSYNDPKLKKNIKLKRSLVYLSIIIMMLYIMAIFIQNSMINKKGKYKKIKKEKMYILFHYILFLFPYILYILNAFINLSYYNDIIYIQELMSFIIDQEYFINNEERFYFLT